MGTWYPPHAEQGDQRSMDMHAGNRPKTRKHAFDVNTRVCRYCYRSELSVGSTGAPCVEHDLDGDDCHTVESREEINWDAHKRFMRGL